MRVLRGVLSLLSLIVLVLPSSRHREMKEIVRVTQQDGTRAGANLLDVRGATRQTGWGKEAQPALVEP